MEDILHRNAWFLTEGVVNISIDRRDLGQWLHFGSCLTQGVGRDKENDDAET